MHRRSSLFQYVRTTRQIILISIFLTSLLAVSPSSEVHAATPTITPIDGAVVTPVTLVNTLLASDSGVTVSNITFTGNNNMGAIFTGGGTIGFTDGIILSSGDTAAISQASSVNASVPYNLSGDTDADALTGGLATEDCSKLEFDFIPTASNASFRFRFGSEEYPEYIADNYNDVFGFFVNGVNRALLPDGTTPILVKTVNHETNSSYYVPNGGGEIEVVYDGMTTIFDVTSPVNASQTNHIKLVICDVGDNNYDSAVFIEGGSFSGNPNNPPTDISLSNSFITGGSPSGSFVGVFSTSDSDAGDSHIYTLVTGAGSTDNSFFSISGNSLLTNGALAGSTYSIRVRSTDDGTGFLYIEKTFTITVGAANQAPVITEGSSVSVTMSEDGNPIAFTLSLNATDPDAGDTLTWSISSAASNGIASASGTGTSKTISYSPAANYNGSDAFTVQVSDGNGGTDSIIVNVTINAVDDPPQLNGSSPTINYTEDDPATPIDPALTFTDVDGPNLNGATVAITSGFIASQDILGFTPSGGITGNFNSTTGVLTLSGSSSVTNYQTVLRSVTYRNSSQTPNTTPRTITFVGDNTLFNTTNSHFYEFVTNSGVAWNTAQTGASSRSLYGMQGYLATITSSQENSFISNRLQGVGWIGASDASTEGTWQWVTGPENGTTFCIGAVICVAQGGRYSNWNAGEPNNSGNEDYGHMIYNTAIGPRGSWNDLPLAGGSGDYTPLGYVVEYGGMPGDPTIQLAATATIQVQSVNDVPVITEGASTTVIMSEDGSPTPFSLTLHATDADGNTLTWSISSPASNGTASATGTGTSKVITYAPTANFNGSDSFTVRVADGAGGSDEILVQVTVNSENDQPVIAEGSSVSVIMDEDGDPTAFALTLNASDTEGEELTWTVSTSPSHGDASASSPGTSTTITYTPDENYNGTDSMIVSVTDATGGQDTIQINITILSINDVPVFSETNPVTVIMDEDGNPIPFSLTLNATDVDLDTLTWSVLSQADHGEAGIAGSGNTRQIEYSPDANYYGADTITIRIDDMNGGTADIQVNVTINQMDDAPTVFHYLADQTGTEDVLFTFTFPSNTFADVDDGTILTYTATLADGSPLPSWLTFDGETRTFSGTPDTGQTLNIRLTATDNTSLAVSDNFLVFITGAGNQSPTNLDPLDGVNLVALVPFNFKLPEGGFFDEENNPLEVDARLPDDSPLPSWLLFNPATLTFSGTPPAPQDLTVKLVVFDGLGGFLTTELPIHVSEGNVGPSLLKRLQDQAAIEGDSFTYTIPVDSFWDANGDTLAYTATLFDDNPLPSWLTFDPQTRTFSGSPLLADAGGYLIKVSALDGGAQSISDLFLIAVSSANRMIVYHPLSAAGTEYTDGFGSVTIPAGLIGADSHTYLHIIQGAGVPPLSNRLSFGKGRDITISTWAGNLIHQFSKPLEICFAVTLNDINKVRGDRSKILFATTDSINGPWSILSSSHPGLMECAETTHLSLFDLFYRAIGANASDLPATGFAPDVVTVVSAQPQDKLYKDQGQMTLAIPSLGVEASVVGVPKVNGNWDVTWLGNQAGWLEGSAYPTWSGNSALTGHVTSADGKPGLFAGLKTLRTGDEILIRSADTTFVYQVQQVLPYLDPTDPSLVTRHEETPWLTLITCQTYDESRDAYRFRLAVRAKLITIREND